MALDMQALTDDIAALRKQFVGPPTEEDVQHLRKMERWTWMCSAVGFGLAWIAPNPISIVLISTARFARWTVLSHPIVHKGYDRTQIGAARYDSHSWAVRWRRYLDWLDWMAPEAWAHEHNQMHHYRLGELADPDLVEETAGFLRESRAPLPLKYAFVAVGASVWKPLYYAPTTWRSWYTEQERKAARTQREGDRVFPAIDWNPLGPVGRLVWRRSWLPFASVHFVLLPLLFAPLGLWASFSVLVNNLLAELLTNLHAFLVIAPNHSGEDCWRFDGKGKGKGDFYVRQIAGSVNYPCGTDTVDFFHGWLNYQIEHHLFPEASMLQYRRMQPHLKALCEKHGLPYVQESVFVRCRKLVEVMVGNASMKRLPEGAEYPFGHAPTEAPATVAK